MFAALLSLLLKKHIIADWEFIDELPQSVRNPRPSIFAINGSSASASRRLPRAMIRSSSRHPSRMAPAQHQASISASVNPPSRRIASACARPSRRRRDARVPAA